MIIGDSSGMMASNGSSRLLVVSNRLPITLQKLHDDWTYTMSSGGLVSALSGLQQTTSFLWIGWPGKDKNTAYTPDFKFLVI